MDGTGRDQLERSESRVVMRDASRVFLCLALLRVCLVASWLVCECYNSCAL